MPPLLLLNQPTRSVPTTNRHGQQQRIRILHRTGLVLAIRRGDIIVREGIADAVQVGLVHDARVMIRGRVLIVLARRGIGQDGVDEQGGAVERSGEAGDEGAGFDVGADGEGARGAAEDVGGGGSGEGEAGAEVEQIGGGVDAPGDSAPGCLGIDGQGLGGVEGPDLVYVILVVVVEEGRVENDAIVGAEGAQVAAGGVGYNEGGPGCAIGGGLGSQTLADIAEAVGRHAGDVLRCVGGVGQGEGDGKADEVDVGDVDEKLSGVEGELAEVPGHVDIWV